MERPDEQHYAKGQLLFAIRHSREMLEDAIRAGPIPPALDTRVRLVVLKLAELVRDFEEEYQRTERIKFQGDAGGGGEGLHGPRP